MEEYDSELYDLCSDGETCGYESTWNDVNKRILINGGRVSLQLEENDDPTVLSLLFNILQEGISDEFLSYQLQIEQLHNAIVCNPSQGRARVLKMRRLEELCDASSERILYAKDVDSINIPNAVGFTLPFTNIKFANIGCPTKNVLGQLQKMAHLEYLTLSGSLPTFSMSTGFDNLESITLIDTTSSIENLNRMCTAANSRYIQYARS